jgi:hypothetical protein
MMLGINSNERDSIRRSEARSGIPKVGGTLQIFSVLRLFLDTRTSKSPTAHIVISVLRLFTARLVYVKPHRY